MAARSGSEFLERLSAARVHVEIQGETLTGGVADHPAFRNVVRSYAELYDMQHDPAFRDILTYPSPATGEPVGTSFLQPRTHDDLTKRRQAFKAWADRSLGMLGRTGDYLNSALMAHIVREDDNGIVIRGARLLATIGPFADELLVFPSTVLRNTPEDKQYSFACAIANDTPGLRYLAREPLDYGRPGTITRSAPGSRKPTRSSSSMTSTFPTSAASCSVTPNSATASTPAPQPWCT
jgi:4-hydroxyphenylacetate 3-monooxygenase